MPQLRPVLDAFEDRRSNGLTASGMLQVALVGGGAILISDVLRHAFTRDNTPPAPEPGSGTTVTTPPPMPKQVPDEQTLQEIHEELLQLLAAGAPAQEGGWVNPPTLSDVTVSDDMAVQLASVNLGTVPGTSDDSGLDPFAPPDEASGHSGGGGGGGAAASGSGGGGNAVAGAAGAGSASVSGGGGSAAAGTGSGLGGNSLVPPLTFNVPASTAPSAAIHSVTAASAGTSASGLTTGPSVTPDATNVSKSYGQLPLSFELNLGQTASGVQYLSHNAGVQFFLSSDGSATLALTPAGQNNPAGATLTQDVLRLSLQGANPSPQFVPEDQLPSYSNYFSGGANPLSITNVPQYGEIVEQNVYPGINVVWHASANHQLEYDFQVTPGANPSVIQLHVEGATGLSSDAHGNLLIGTPGGTLVQSGPTITQPGLSGNALPQSVSGSTLLLPNGNVGFQLGSYNPAQTLTIDPTIQYSSFLGGSGNDKAYAVAADGSGDSYIAGITQSSNFPTTTGAYETSSPGGTALFISKLNPTGQALVYSTYLSGPTSSTSQLFGLAVDAAENVYITGTTGASNFPTTAGAYMTSPPASGSPSFVTKLNATGDTLLYSTYFGIGSTAAAAIAVDPAGDAYLTGQTPASFGGSNFPTTASAFQTSAGSGTHAFVSELNAAGSALVYSSFLAGSGTDKGYGIAVDNQRDALVSGSTNSTNFPTTSGAYSTSNGGGATEVFVSQVNPTGSALTYSTYVGPGTGYAIALNSSGNAYLTGSAASSSYPTTGGAYQSAFGGTTEAFITEMKTDGSGLVYSTYLGGNGNTSGAGIAVDPSGYADVTGTTSSSAGMLGMGGFPTTSGALQSTFRRRHRRCVCHTPGAGRRRRWPIPRTWVGRTDDAGTGVAVDAFNNAYLAGYSNSTNFPTAECAARQSIGRQQLRRLDVGVGPIAGRAGLHQRHRRHQHVLGRRDIFAEHHPQRHRPPPAPR